MSKLGTSWSPSLPSHQLLNLTRVEAKEKEISSTQEVEANLHLLPCKVHLDAQCAEAQEFEGGRNIAGGKDRKAAGGDEEALLGPC